jgi:hypothetical protein
MRPHAIGAAGYGGYGYGYGGFGYAGLGYGPFGYGYGLDSIFIGGGFYCDPFSLMYGGGPLCLNPYFFGPSNFNSFGMFSPYYDPYASFDYPGNGSGGYTPGFGVSSYTDQSMTPLQSSVYLSNGTLPGLTPTPPPDNPGAAAETSSTSSSPGEQALIDASSRPPSQVQAFAEAGGQSNSEVTLVLVDGTTVPASQCWLGDDWQFHYVTASGEQKAIQFSQLDLQATANANGQRGVSFLLPVAPQSQQKPN